MTDLPHVQDVESLKRALRLVRRGTTPHTVTAAHLEANGFTADAAADTTAFLTAFGFLTPDGTPTESWLAYRDSEDPNSVLLAAERSTYPDLAARVDDDAQVDDETLAEVVQTDDPETAHLVVATFRKLSDLAVSGPGSTPSESARPRREVIQDVSMLLQLSVREFDVARQCLHHDLLRPAIVSAWNSYAALAFAHLATDDFAILRRGSNAPTPLADLMRAVQGRDLVAILVEHALVPAEARTRIEELLRQRDDAAQPLPDEPDRAATAEYLSAILTISAELTDGPAT
jgi:hypothetical protein